MSLTLPEFPNVETFVNRWGWSRNIIPKISMVDMTDYGSYDLKTRTIKIKKGMSVLDVEIAIVHEFRHMWQHLEKKSISLKTEFKSCEVLIEYVKQTHEADAFQNEYDFYFEFYNGRGSIFESQYKQLFEYGVIF